MLRATTNKIINTDNDTDDVKNTDKNPSLAQNTKLIGKVFAFLTRDGF